MGLRRGGVGVSPLNISVWRDFPLHERLSSLTGLETHIDEADLVTLYFSGIRGFPGG